MKRNSLINLLPPKIQERILLKSDTFELQISQVICEVNKPIQYLYFPIEGFISITQGVSRHPALEVGMIGREGVLGGEISLGRKTNSFGAIVQGAGFARRLSVIDFLKETSQCLKLRTVIDLYLAVRLGQLGQSAACEHFHRIGPRLAKWLLMSQDRAQSATFSMTHEFIALMLGIRRVGVTTTAANFKRRGLIEYHRGEMKILDRIGLRAIACSCYQADNNLYLSLMKDVQNQRQITQPRK